MKFIDCFISGIFLFLLVFTVGCDECQDCEPIDAKDPGIFVTFINNTQISKVIDSLEVYSTDSLDLSEELKKVNSDLENENLSEEESTALRRERDEITANIKAKNELIAQERKLLKDLREGRTSIEALHTAGSIDTLSFQADTMFRFPLRPDYDTTIFKILFNDREDILTFFYNRDIKVVEDRIKIKATGIKKGSNTFDKVDLDTTNILDETRAKVYY